MKVLVTGADGYIGARLLPHLVARGHSVTGLDAGFYSETDFITGQERSVRPIRKDIRDITERDLAGFEAVVHLAELSNDPLGQLNPDVTYQINHLGSVGLARLCKRAGVSRFIYTSSCSVYGIEEDGVRTEESAVCPQTAYAECKVLVERDVSRLATDDFSPTFLRNATAYGPSPRMRFDLVVNNLSGFAWTTREIRMTSDGTPWRPLVHVLDICEAIACTLEAPRDVIHDQIFNVGATAENYRVREVAKIVSDTFPGCELSIGTSDGDNRSYRVSFDKIHGKLPAFRCQYNVQQGVLQLRETFERIGLTKEMFKCRAFTRLHQLQHLLSTGRLDSNLFWKKTA